MTLIERLKKHEGFRSKPYRCPAGKLTIGYGRNIQDNGITKAEALFLLTEDVKRCRAECERAFSWFKDIDQTRQDVIVELKQYLSDTDYIANKMIEAIDDAELQDLKEKYADTLKKRREARAEINQLEK